MSNISTNMGIFKTSMSDAKVPVLLFACFSQHSGWFACCSKEADKARRWCCDFACEKAKDTLNSVLRLGQAFKNICKKGPSEK